MMNVSRLAISRRWFLSSAAAIAAVHGGIGGAQAQDRPLAIGRPTDARTLDPAMDTSDIGRGVFKNIFDQLIDIAGDGTAVAGVAESWTTNDDASVWEFTLRDGVRFPNGSTMTAEDVLFSFERIMTNEASPMRTYTRLISKVSAPGPMTVRFDLSEPFTPFLRQLSLVPIVPKYAYQDTARDFAVEAEGSGPYRVVEWVRDDRMVFRANEDYWRGAPAIKDIVLRPIPADNSRVAALLSGEIDIMPALPPSSLRQLEGNADLDIQTIASNRIVYLASNVRHPMLSDPKLRKAIDLSINREAIVTRLLRGSGKPEGQLVAPSVFGYDPAFTAVEQDLEAARALVAESSYDGSVIALQYASNRFPFAAEVAQAIAGFLDAIGVKVDLQGMEYTAMFPLWANMELPALHLFSFGPTSMDAALVINSLFNTRPYFDSDEARALNLAQLAASDETERQAIISRLWQLNRDEAGYLPLYNEFQNFGSRPSVAFTPRADEHIQFNELSWK
jgi:peptide/nickel transport system substrate-binding protein